MSADDLVNRLKMLLETSMDDQRMWLGSKEWHSHLTLMHHLTSALRITSLAVSSPSPLTQTSY